ncbi:MAG: hypothetical protein AM326_03110 [Candidatus Thorarchaeota archaeon SMTZ-45]|nr:MAG: hypothetical protein AM326_03110 [Candidatus Thorarchaeota archaeon SMTZ-45]
MPKSLTELQNCTINPKRKGGKKIDFAPIVKSIIESGKFWSVSEVHTKMVQKKVSRFRTMKLLQRAVTGRRLQCRDLKGTYYYGDAQLK